MRIVSNASPLIFLAKGGRLELLPALVGTDMLVPDQVQEEVLASPVTPAERLVLERLIAACRVVTVVPVAEFAGALSVADAAVIGAAVTAGADLVLADDRLLRETAVAEGKQVLGTLGILLKAVERGLLPAAEARTVLEQLVSTHGFRIGVALYARVLTELAKCG